MPDDEKVVVRCADCETRFVVRAEAARTNRRLRCLRCMRKAQEARGMQPAHVDDDQIVAWLTENDPDEHF